MNAVEARHNAEPSSVGLPVVRIEPSRGWRTLGLVELWDYRELLYFLTWRDVKVRYKQTVLGVLWAVVQPALTLLVFALLFGRWAKIPSDGAPYPLFVFAGLVPWTFFANAVGASANSLVGQTHLISKVYFPRLIIPVASLGAGLVDLAITLTLLILTMAASGMGVSWRMIGLPALLALNVLAALAAGTALAGLSATYRDFRYVVPFLLQLWLFASPVIYPVTLVPGEWRWLLYLNPMTGVIDAYRWALLGADCNWGSIGTAWPVVVVASLGSVAYFRRAERRFADVL